MALYTLDDAKLRIEFVPADGHTVHGGQVAVAALCKRLGLWQLLRAEPALDPDKTPIGSSSPPVVVGDVVIVGSAFAAGAAPPRKEMPKGNVMAFDARTGKRLWVFHTIARKGEVGGDTWTDEAREYTGNAPLAFVVSLNLHRRHLTESQRASVAAKLANMAQGARTDVEPSANLQKVAISQSEAASMLNVSTRSVSDAAKVIHNAAPDNPLDFRMHLCRQ